MTDIDDSLYKHRATEGSVKELINAVGLLTALIDSGRLKVDASGVTLNTDLVNVENIKLQDIAGDGVNPASEDTLAEVKTAVEASRSAAENMDVVVDSTYTVTVTNSSQSLSDLGVTVPAGAVGIRMTYNGAYANYVHYEVDGTAATTSQAQITSGAYEPMTNALLGAMELISDSGTVDISIVLYVQRS